MPGIESIRGVIGFVRTVAAGSFAGAAKELGVSPVAVSKNVQRLERRLGVRLLPEFSRRYPDIEVELHLDDAISDMIAGGYDVGIRAGEMKDAAMIVREIAPLHFVVCGAPSYLARHGMPRKPADLANHNCLRLRSRPAPAKAAGWLLGPDNAPASPPVRGNFLANDVTALVTAAVHGHGLVFAPPPPA